MKRSEFKQQLGGAFHTAFRKATDSEASVVIWNALSKIPEDEWDSVLEFVVDCLPEEIRGAKPEPLIPDEPVKVSEKKDRHIRDLKDLVRFKEEELSHTHKELRRYIDQSIGWQSEFEKANTVLKKYGRHLGTCKFGEQGDDTCTCRYSKTTDKDGGLKRW